MTLDIPNYRVLEKLGEGAQTRIFRARCMRTGKDYAVKVVKIVKPEEVSFADLLRTEHTIGSALSHPILREVYELRTLRQRLRLRGAMLFMEYVDGVPMSDKSIDRSFDEVLRVIAEAARGLRAMHEAGFVHADIKPSNILVSEDGEVKLIDFGQSCRLREAKPRIQGTIDYIAPEQVQRGQLDERTDVFGLGAALHRILTGAPVATEMNQQISMSSTSLVGKRVDQVRKPSIEDLPHCIARIIADSCQTDPEERIADMPALIERLILARTILERKANGTTYNEDDELEYMGEEDSPEAEENQTLIDELDITQDDGPSA